MPSSGQWAELQQLFNQFALPELKQAGFSRKGNFSMIKRDAEDDLWVLVRMKPYTPIPIRSFFIDWAVVPQTLRDFYRHIKSGARIDLMEYTLLIEGRLEAPTELRYQPLDRSTWNWDPEGKFHTKRTMEQFGTIFASALRSSGIPLWDRLLDRDQAAAYPTHGYSAYYEHRYPEVAQLLLYIDRVDPAVADQWLVNLENRSEFPFRLLRRYLRERLDNRRAATDGRLAD